MGADYGSGFSVVLLRYSVAVLGIAPVVATSRRPGEYKEPIPSLLSTFLFLLPFHSPLHLRSCPLLLSLWPVRVSLSPRPLPRARMAELHLWRGIHGFGAVDWSSHDRHDPRYALERHGSTLSVSHRMVRSGSQARSCEVEGSADAEVPFPSLVRSIDRLGLIPSAYRSRRRLGMPAGQPTI